MRILNVITDFLIRLEHRIYIEIKRMKLKNRNPSILSSNCNGALILHDMKCPFNSPTVNLFFLPKDFLKFARNPERYLKMVPIEVKVPGISFPVGHLDDILLFFMHYNTFEEARDKWVERSKRVNINNVFFMMTERNGCVYEDLKAFDELPYKKKVVFTKEPHPELKSAYYIPGSEEGDEVGILSSFKKTGFWRRRWLDDFDYISFLNGMDSTL